MNILTTCQDPGGCNAIAPVIAALTRRGYDVGDHVAKPGVVLMGTSGGPSIEKEVTLTWRGRVPTIAVLDFWSNYWQRFSSPGVKDFKYLPDIVCVMDDIAKKEMIAEGFSPEQMRVTGNPHFDHFTDGITRENEDPMRILFISQPIRTDDAVPGFIASPTDEYGMLETLQKYLPVDHTLSIRLHPRDEKEKYNAYLGDRVSLANEPTLEEALSRSGLIVGPASPVLMQATVAGKKTLHYVPDPSIPDPMVSDRVGVTVRIEGPEALGKALTDYAAGQWHYRTRPLREVWPLGATERVVAEVLALRAK